MARNARGIGAEVIAVVLAGALAAWSHAADLELKRALDRYKMERGEVRCKDEGGAIAVRWAMYRPRATSQKLPVVVFLPGLGELGPDLSHLFRNRSIFDIVTSPEFQRKHPCVFVALQTEAGVERHCIDAGRAAPALAAMSAALEDALSRLGRARIDRERVYLTGLSAGGGACCSMICAYPGRFAAALPISAMVHPNLLSKTVPENIWMVYNSGELKSARGCIDFDRVAGEMKDRGGDFRVGELTGEGHNAWDASWREETFWDWLFSKRASVGGGFAENRRGAAAKDVSLPRLQCSASARAESDASLPRFGADGLSGTAYRSGAAARKGDWWQVEFDSPRAGSMKIVTGDAQGRFKVQKGSVMVSADGRHWSKTVAVRDGNAAFRTDRAVRFVRLQLDASQSGPFAVREFELR